MSENEKVKKVLLGELGMNMPLGISTEQGIIKSFAFRPWRFKEEKKLAELVEKKNNTNLAEYVSIILSTMCTQVGPHNFENLKWEEKLAIISQMWMGDVFYIYIMLRKEAIGKELELEPICPTCGTTFNFIGDLETVEVSVVEEMDDALWKYVLRNPFNIRKKRIESLILGPPRWNEIEMLKDNDSVLNVGAKMTMIKGSIHSIDELEGQHILLENELDEMTKIDIETISSQIDSFTIGPNMFLEGECPKKNCLSRKSGKKFRQEIDWRYESFFGISSR